ncbi:hypothetical protein [Ferruginibacter sp.]|uniref:hypothetical protein n=1 Tax=Ferruginibacter sp. TaxID=1940288 RepID=UPI00265AC831|nr:hypothetical protein [Ferruginibacter sp.]
MQTQKISLANIKGKLSRTEMKNIMAGYGEGCGTGISCSNKASGDSCGTKFCLCQTHTSTDSTLYCTVQK